MTRRVDEIARRALAGETITAIARDEGITRQAVSQLVHRAGIRLDRRHIDRSRAGGQRTQSNVLRLHGEGLQNLEIAHELGISYETVSHWLRRSGLAPNRRGLVHGTETGYGYWRCRCDRCKQAQRDGRLERLARLGIPEHVHGTDNGYRNYGCRCDPCRAAGAASWQAYSAKRRKAAVTA